MTFKAAVVVSLAVAACAFGCSGSNTAPSTTPTVTPHTTLSPSSVLYPLDAQLFWVDIVGTTGTITATLTSASPPNAVVGLGIGLHSGTCLLTKSVAATSGAQISVPITEGLYCVEVFDNGTLTAQVPYQLAITYP